jgi:DNA polymerase III subunit gamma/tau
VAKLAVCDTVGTVSTSANLAVRYRPRRFAELTGQRHVAAVLTAAIAQQRLPQQLLLTGGSGLGKTTVARIAAAAALCETPLGERDGGDACGTCRSCELISQPTSQHPDVIELDAASHGGKDEIVAIVNRAQTRPLLGQFKVYIIDEVHALSGAGVQAFLKLLEEPPPHVLFMLATTNPEKLSSRAGGTGTIRGRCVEFELLAPTETELVANLTRIAAAEGWPLSAETAAMVVDVADPALGVRGTVNLLSKLSGPLTAGQEPDAVEVTALLGALPRQALTTLTDAIRQRDLTAALAQLGQVRQVSSDRNIRSALIRWARRSLDDALAGRAAISAEVALHRFELLLQAPEGLLHTDLVVARLARPSVVADAETLSAQLHEARRVLERLDSLLPLGTHTTGAHATGTHATSTHVHSTPPGPPTEAAEQTATGRADTAAAAETSAAGELPTGKTPGAERLSGAATLTDSSERSASMALGSSQVRGAPADPDRDDVDPIAGSFDDLSDLHHLRKPPVAQRDPEPTSSAPSAAVTPTPAGRTRTPQDAKTRRGSRPTTEKSLPSVNASAAGKTPRGADSGDGRGSPAAAVTWDAFADRVQRRSVTAAALVRSVGFSATPGHIVLRVPEGLRARIHAHLGHLQATAAELTATLEVIGSDAE